MITSLMHDKEITSRNTLPSTLRRCFSPSPPPLSQPRSQCLFPGLGAGQGKDPGNEVASQYLRFLFWSVSSFLTSSDAPPPPLSLLLT